MDQEPNMAPALAACTEEERQEAMGRFAVLRPHLNDGVPLPEAARDAGVPLRSVQRWLARYRATGLAGLVRATRSDTGHRKHPAKCVEAIEGMALRKPRPSVATIHRLMRAPATKRKGTPPSYSSVYGIVRHLNPAMVTLAQDGPAAFRDRYELIYRHRAECPNAIWQADHTLLDIMVLDANGEAVRPWLTMIIDDYSRAVAGYTIFLGAPTALQTALALRQAIWSKQHAAWPVCGIPDVLHVDHGSDFTSTHLEQVAADLHCQLVYSTVGRPQGRGKVERLFGTLNTECVIFQRGVHSSQEEFNKGASWCRCSASKRLTVAGCTWNNRAAAAGVCRPDVTRSTIAACCCGPSLGRRPPMRPWARATANPAWVRSRIIARSNSAKLPTICMSIRPAGVVVSMASVKLRKPAPACAMRSIICSRSFRERDNRSSFQTITTSSGRS